MLKLNPLLKKMYCVRCGRTFEVSDYFTGCPTCGEKGFPANLSFQYDKRQQIYTDKKRMFRYQDFLPYLDFPSLGEGATPVIEVKKIADLFKLNKVYIKNEFQNPTGSHKDRMSALVVARAISLGKECVVAASSGNAGASLSSYAAEAGIKCKIITTKNMNPIWKKAIEIPGADIVFMDTPQERWPYMQEMVEKEGWYPVTNYVSPPVGSNPFGIQGYKTISYEVYEDFSNKLPAYILVPTCRADLLWGIFEGFKDLKVLGLIKDIPHLVAVEPFPRISKILDGADYRDTFPGNSARTSSIGGTSVTYQAVVAIKESGGFASNVKQAEIGDYVQKMAQVGFYLESSSATIFGALKQAVECNKIPTGADVLMIATSSGYKDYPV